jgi:hypothetical protein
LGSPRSVCTCEVFTEHLQGQVCVRSFFSLTQLQISVPLLQHPKEHLTSSSSHAAPKKVLTQSSHSKARLYSKTVQSTAPNSKDGTSRNRNPRVQRHNARNHRPRILARRDQQPTHPSHNHNLNNHWQNHIDLRVGPPCLPVPDRHALHRLQPRSTATWTGRRTRAFE